MPLEYASCTSGQWGKKTGRDDPATSVPSGLCLTVRPRRTCPGPIWDWSKTEVVDAIAKGGLKLSGEYAWMKRSFDGIHVGSGADQEECARPSEDLRLVFVRRGGGLAARKGRIAMTWREMAG